MKAPFVSWFCHTPVCPKFTLGTIFILKTQFCATHGLFTFFIIFKQNEQEPWLSFPSLEPSVLSSIFPVLIKGGLDHSSHAKYHWAITESDSNFLGISIGPKTALSTWLRYLSYHWFLFDEGSYSEVKKKKKKSKLWPLYPPMT